jgi:hypothetical protein
VSASVNAPPSKTMEDPMNRRRGKIMTGSDYNDR